MQHLRLTHSSLNFWVDIRLREFDGRWLAVAEVAGEPELGTGETRRRALTSALRPFGRTVAAELVELAEREMS